MRRYYRCIRAYTRLVAEVYRECKATFIYLGLSNRICEIHIRPLFEIFYNLYCEKRNGSLIIGGFTFNECIRVQISRSPLASHLHNIIPHGNNFGSTNFYRAHAISTIIYNNIYRRGLFVCVCV